jgi:hypothetical protein
MMAEVTLPYSVEEQITTAINNALDFRRIWPSGCLPHHHKTGDGIVRSVTVTSVPW